jgi:L-amino acid N-acyltransferase YncA
MTLIVRPAISADAPAMTQLLNAVIAIGGTTAHQRSFDADRMLHHYIAPDGLISCVVAEADARIVGFQVLVWPNDAGDPFPDGWAIIASFVQPGLTGQGIGRALFAATRRKAVSSGVRTIDATIRADNAGGLAYYAAQGFVDYAVLRDVPLRSGTCVDRVRKRLDLGSIPAAAV